MKRTFILAAILALGLGFGGSQSAVRAQTAGNTITFPAGTSLVSGPPGSDFTAVDGALSTLQSSDHEYESVQPSAGTQAGYGYWAQFAQPTSVQLNQGSNMPLTASALAGQWILIGDPSGTLPATVMGASAVYTYDPTSGYKTATTLQPGQGAWALGSGGGSITIVPQTPAALAAAASLRTFTGKGFQIGIPTDWDRISLGQSPVDVTAEWAPADGNALLSVWGPESLPAGVPINAVRLMTALFGQPKVLAAFGSNTQVSAAPAALTVQGADTAAVASLTATDPQAGPEGITQAMAVANNNYYLVEVVSSPDYASKNQALIQQILQSFQLTP